MASVLIINQKKTVTARLEGILEGMGHKIIGTPDTTLEAMSLVGTLTPDIIYIDLAFGNGHDGTQFAQIVLNEHAAKLIFLVSSANKSNAQRARALSPAGYLVVPFTAQSVDASLSEALNPYQTAEIPVILQNVIADPKVQVWNQISEDLLIQVRAYIRANLDKEITLRSMSDVAGMSESNFSRRFKASMGITPYQYVLQERLEEAKHLLRHKNMSLVHIAAATGFSSQSHFTTVFKKSTTLTPLQYRRQ